MELSRLRAENGRLRMEDEILKKDGVLRQGRAVRYAWIAEHAGVWPVARRAGRWT